jgi:small subunit ribosomal protein S6
MENRQYEALYILHPHLDEEAISGAVNKFEESIKHLGGSIEKTEKQGRKKLSFQVQKLNDGYFVLTYFKLPPNKVVELRQYCKLAEPIVRHLISKKVG